jgi:hypothetical protein
MLVKTITGLSENRYEQELNIQNLEVMRNLPIVIQPETFLSMN